MMMIMIIGYNDDDDHRHRGGNCDGRGVCDHQQDNHDYRDHADLE